MGEILISRAPEDPNEKDQWVKQMARLQFAMFVDDNARCVECGRFYLSTDDMIDRNPRYTGAEAFENKFVDEACFESFLSKHPELTGGIQRRNFTEMV